VSDGTSIVTETCLVTVIDTIAPTLAPSVSANILWPPNHKMSEVLIRANAHDNSGGTITLSIVITDNQPGHKNNKKSGLSNCSIERFDQAMGVIALQLRAERSGKGGDHLYTITISAQDESGNSSSADVIVKVPHDMGRL
jgi:hypothetical protein